MFVTLSDQVEMMVAASEAWKVYSSLGFSKLIVQLFPEMFDSIDAVEGDGEVGTVLQITLPPDANGHVTQYKEKFSVIDEEKRLKVVEIIEGGFLEQGLDHYQVQFQVTEKQEIEGEDSCIVKVRIEYDTKDLTAARNAVGSIGITVLMEAVADYLSK